MPGVAGNTPYDTVRSRSEFRVYLATGIAFVLSGVWAVVGRPDRWSWVVFSFLVAAVPMGGIALVGRHRGWWWNTALGVVLLGLLFGIFWWAGWPKGTGDWICFLAGFGAGNFLSAALRLHVEHRPS